MRIAILTAESPQGNSITAALIRRHPSVVCGIVEARGVERGRPIWRSALALAGRVAPGFLAWKVAERAAGAAAWRSLRRRGVPGVIPTLDDLAREVGIPLVATRDVNDADTMAILARWRIDLAVSVHFTHKIGVATVRMARLGMLNVHGALLPRNRGLFPYFWQLANGDAEAGVTLHWIDEDLDTGDVVSQCRLPIAADETVGSLSWKGARHGAALVVEAVDAMLAGETLPRRRQCGEESSYFSWPTAADVRALRSRGRHFGSVTEAWHRIVGAARSDAWTNAV